MTTGLPSGGFIEQQSPNFIGVQNGTILDVKLEYINMDTGKTHVRGFF